MKNNLYLSDYTNKKEENISKINYNKIWNSTRICKPKIKRQVYIIVEHENHDKKEIPLLLKAQLLENNQWFINEINNNNTKIEDISINNILFNIYNVIFWRLAE